MPTYRFALEIKVRPKGGSTSILVRQGSAWVAWKSFTGSPSIREVRMGLKALVPKIIDRQTCPYLKKPPATTPKRAIAERLERLYATIRTEQGLEPTTGYKVAKALLARESKKGGRIPSLYDDRRPNGRSIKAECVGEKLRRQLAALATRVVVRKRVVPHYCTPSQVTRYHFDFPPVKKGRKR